MLPFHCTPDSTLIVTPKTVSNRVIHSSLTITPIVIADTAPNISRHGAPYIYIFYTPPDITPLVTPHTS